jgi:diaminopimelate epimerase
MIPFVKAHGYGNDFLYVERAHAGERLSSDLARDMCDRHRGVGADGLIVYARTEDGAEMGLWNADGSAAEVSGNGVRGLAALLLRETESLNAVVSIRTDAGVKQLTRTDRFALRQTFRAAMGQPAGLQVVSIDMGAETVSAVVLNMGNPQCVVLGPLPDDNRFHQLSAALEHHAMFPAGTNVAFAEVETPGRVVVRVWERGCGATLSSGTGSCAALVAAASFGAADRSADVVAPGGAQRVDWVTDGVYLTGWAEIVAEGQWLR